MIRIVIVDDSPFVREVLRARLARFSDLAIVGEAGDGETAARMVAELRPDVVTMDVVMPLVPGLDAVRAIMARTPTPIIVVSDARGGVDRLMVDAIAAGALDVFVKPPRGFDDEVAGQLAAVLRTAASARLVKPAQPMPLHRGWDATVKQMAGASIIGIAASTGGPQVLHQLVRALPRDFSTPVAIVQHTAVGFTEPLVAWLGDGAPIDVTIARTGEPARGVVVAPDDQHLEIDRRGHIALHREPPVRGHRPAGTILLRSLAVHGSRAVGIVCTGMSDDGALGLAAIEAAGGVAIVEDPRTAAIDAMPRAAIAATRTALVATIPQIGDLLRRAGGGA